MIRAVTGAILTNKTLPRFVSILVLGRPVESTQRPSILDSRPAKFGQPAMEASRTAATSGNSEHRGHGWVGADHDYATRFGQIQNRSKSTGARPTRGSQLFEFTSVDLGPV